jgi:hypothetical protein
MFHRTSKILRLDESKGKEEIKVFPSDYKLKNKIEFTFDTPINTQIYEPNGEIVVSQLDTKTIVTYEVSLLASYETLPKSDKKSLNVRVNDMKFRAFSDDVMYNYFIVTQAVDGGLINVYAVESRSWEIKTKGVDKQDQANVSKTVEYTYQTNEPIPVMPSNPSLNAQFLKFLNPNFI